MDYDAVHDQIVTLADEIEALGDEATADSIIRQLRAANSPTCHEPRSEYARLLELAEYHYATLSATPKFHRVAAGDYETRDGRYRLYRLVGVYPPAWNVEEIPQNGGRHVRPPGDPALWGGFAGDLCVDGAATKRDALALFNDYLEGRKPLTDIRVQPEGTISVLYGESAEGRDWLAENLAGDAVRWGPHGYVVEHRYVDPILEGAAEDGLAVGVEPDSDVPVVASARLPRRES